MTMLPPDVDEERRSDQEAEDREPGLAALPSFDAGGRVERTGIALVHEGEYIVPAPASEAVIAHTGDWAGEDMAVNYYFPVVIEVVGTLGDSHLEHVSTHIFDELNAAWRS